MTRSTRERARVAGLAALLATALWLGDGSVTRAEPEGPGGTPGIATPAPADPERAVEEAAREAERLRVEQEQQRAELERERQQLQAEMERERQQLQRERQARAARRAAPRPAANAARLPIVQIREITPRR